MIDHSSVAEKTHYKTFLFVTISFYFKQNYENSV